MTRVRALFPQLVFFILGACTAAGSGKFILNFVMIKWFFGVQIIIVLPSHTTML